MGPFLAFNTNDYKYLKSLIFIWIKYLNTMSCLSRYSTGNKAERNEKYLLP
jgi:hypothetical protein